MAHLEWNDCWEAGLEAFQWTNYCYLTTPTRLQARGAFACPFWFVEGLTADCGSSKKGYADCGVTAERGCGVWGSFCVFNRHRNCCPDMGDAENGVKFFCEKRPGADTVVMAEEGVRPDGPAVHWSCGVKKPPIWSG